LLLAALLVLAALFPTPARAHGDLASEVLATQWIFLPPKAPIPRGDVRRLEDAVQKARDSGYPVKVALIASRADLRSLASLWKKPQRYARWLGRDLASVYAGAVLVAMPNGYGLFGGRGSAVGDRLALAGLEARIPARALADAAVAAIVRLTATRGRQVVVPASADADGSSTSVDRLVIVAAAAGLLLLLIPPLWLRRRRSAR